LPTIASTGGAFDDAMVTGWEELEPGIHLHDGDDRVRHLEALFQALTQIS
jgi:hypothetical protein